MIEVAFFVSLLTVAGGATLATLYLRAGGLRRSAPDLSMAGLPAGEVVNRPVPGGRSRISVSRVAMHATFGLSAATFLGLGAVSDSLDRQGALIGALAAVMAAVLGIALVRTGKGSRPEPGPDGVSDPPEDHLPGLVVTAHGLAALATIVLGTVAVFAVW